MGIADMAVRAATTAVQTARTTMDTIRQAAQQNPEAVVDAAADRINERLDGTGTFGVTNASDVAAVADTIAGVEAWAGQDAADALVARMEESGDLERFADNMYDGAMQGGPSTDQRRDIYNTLAQSLSGEALATVAGAIDAQDPGIISQERVGELTTAMQTHSSIATRQDYIAAAASDPNTAFEFDRNNNAVGLSAARLMSDLPTSALQQTLNELSPQQLERVLSNTIENDTQRHGGVFSRSYASYGFDTSQFESLANRVADLQGPGSLYARANFFNAGGRLVDNVAYADRASWENVAASVGGTYRDTTDATRQMTDALTGVLRSNTNGVMNTLNQNEVLRQSGGMQRYVEGLIDIGDTQTLSSITLDLAYGQTAAGVPDLSANATERFNANDTTAIEGVQHDGRVVTTERSVFMNANNLGYFTETVNNAADAAQIEEARENQLMGEMLSIITAGVSETGAPAVGVISEALKVLQANAGTQDYDFGHLSAIAQPDEGGVSTYSDGANNAFTSGVREANTAETNLQARDPR